MEYKRDVYVILKCYSSVKVISKTVTKKGVLMKRIFLIVLDSFGIGEMADAEQFGDKGTNTIGSVSTSTYFDVPNLKELGLFNMEGISCEKKEPVK